MLFSFPFFFFLHTSHRHIDQKWTSDSIQGTSLCTIVSIQSLRKFPPRVFLIKTIPRSNNVSFYTKQDKSNQGKEYSYCEKILTIGVFVNHKLNVSYLISIKRWTCIYDQLAQKSNNLVMVTGSLFEDTDLCGYRIFMRS